MDSLQQDVLNTWTTAMDHFITLYESTAWETFKTKEDFTASRIPSDKLFNIKGECMVPLAPGPIIDFIREPSNKTKFDEDIDYAELLTKVDDNLQILYNRVKTPPIVWTRDVVFVQGMKEIDGTFYIASKSVEFGGKPPVDGYVRAEVIIAGYVVKPIEESKCMLTYIMNVNPGGWLPGFVINQVQKTQVENVLRIRDILLK